MSSRSNLQISIEPQQSSYFAGEEFNCTITFTNTLPPVPQSVPLPSTATLGDVGSSSSRRVVSLGVGSNGGLGHSSPRRRDLELPRQESISNGGSSSSSSSTSSNTFLQLPSYEAPPPVRRKHNKSQSVDVRTFARQNQLQPLGLDEELGSEEKYYQDVAEEKEKEVLNVRDLYTYDELPTRKRLIGKTLGPTRNGKENGQSLRFLQDARSSTPAKKHNKAFSVAVPSQYYPQQHDTETGSGKGAEASKTPAIPAFADSPRHPSQHILLNANAPSPAVSRNVSSSLRQPSGPISPEHPHSRKKSVAQIQAEDLSGTFEYDGGASPGAGSTPTQSSSVTPRGSLDVRNRDLNGGQSFYNLGDNTTMESVLRDNVTQWSNAETQRPEPTLLSKSSRSSTVPGTETLLWSFAQFGGSFQIDESLVKPGEFEQVKANLAGGAGNGMPGSSSSQSNLTGIGGGEFGSVGEAGEEQSRAGWGAYFRGVLGGGSGGSARSSDRRKQSLSVTNAHRRTSSTLDDKRTKTLASKSIPIYSNAPSMITVDLKLAPGESRSFTYSIPLPPDLPPSYAGKAISLVYTLTVGTNRMGQSRQGTVEQKSRLVRVPMRVYNLVNVSGITSFFDLTNPIVNLKDVAEVCERGKTAATTLRAIEATVASVNRREARQRQAASEHDLLDYTADLLSSCREEGEVETDDVPTDVEVATELARRRGGHSSPLRRAHLQLAPDSRLGRVAGRGMDPNAGLGLSSTDDEDELPKSSLQAVEILSRNSSKVSYDISKDGQVAAVLTLIKSKYRLGDTISGVVSINGRNGVARVVRIAANLESHEEIESSLSTLPANRSQKLTRIVHGEFHENTLDLGQVCFSLPIPSGATPNFVTSAVKLAWTVRLSFLMLSAVQSTHDQSVKSQLQGHLVPSIDDGYSAYHHAYRAQSSLAGPRSAGQPHTPEEAKLELVECAVPLTILPHSTRFTAGQIAFVA